MSSQVDKKVNDKILMWLNEQCGEHSEVKTTRGCAHDHLGITFGFADKKVKIDVVKCALNVSLKEFPVKFKEANGNITPAGVDVFSKDLSNKLSEEMKIVFHQTVAQGSFLCKRVRPDVQPTMSVSCA